MALPIKRAPVLRGKAARDFYKSWEQMIIRESQISDEETGTESGKYSKNTRIPCQI
ncbi:MAG: hypothetical protein LBR10_15240 [Prevotellaceae bacterium]|jgi:hypothetical protein|nr:hypothetical protein [Prevotellaceae bacterium]